MHIVQAREGTGQAYVEGQVTIGTRRVSKRDIAQQQRSILSSTKQLLQSAR